MPEARQEVSWPTSAPPTQMRQKGVKFASPPAQLSLPQSPGGGHQLWVPFCFALDLLKPGGTPLHPPTLPLHPPTPQVAEALLPPLLLSLLPGSPLPPSFLAWLTQPSFPKHQPRRPRDTKHRENDTCMGYMDEAAHGRR